MTISKESESKVNQSSLEITDHDRGGQLGEVIEALLEESSSPDVSVMAEDDDRYLLSISYEDEGEVEDIVCTLGMLCYSKGVYHYTLHYIGREGGGVR